MSTTNQSIASEFMSPGLQISEEFAIEFWMKLSEENLNVDGKVLRKQRLISRKDATREQGLLNTQFNFTLSKFEDKPALSVGFHCNDKSASFLGILPDNIKPNEWHHYAFVLRPLKDPKKLNGLATQISAYLEPVLFIDGDEIAPLFSRGNIYAKYILNEVPLKLAFNSSTAKALFTEIRCWNRALNSQEIFGAMKRQLNGDEPGLIGRWGFEQANAQDSSQSGMDGTMADAPVFKGDIPNLSPAFANEHLVVQSRFMQDYIHKADGPPEEITSHHVVISARDSFGTPMSFVTLTLALHPVDHFLGDHTVKIQIQHDAKIEMCELALPGATQGRVGVLEKIEVTTDVLGQVSFSIPAVGFIAPVFRVHAEFMNDPEHALLIFPDRHVHHILSYLPERVFADFWSWKDTKKKSLASFFYDPVEGGRQPTGQFVEESKSDKGAISAGIKRVMRLASDANQLNEYRHIRTRAEELHVSPHTRPQPDHENIHISSKSFDLESDVISGYSVKDRSPVVKGLEGEMPAWQLKRTAGGTSELYAYQDDVPLEEMLSGLNPEGDDELAMRIWEMHHGSRQRTVIDSTELVQLLDKSTRTRSFFELETEVYNASRMIMHTVKGKVRDVETGVEKDIQAVMMVLVREGKRAKSYVIHRAAQAVKIVEGFLLKMQVKIEDFILYIRSIFDWKRVIGVAELSDEIMRKNFVACQDGIGGMKGLLASELSRFQEKTLGEIDSLIDKLSDPSVKNSMNRGQSAKRHHKPKGVHGSYLHRMTACHSSQITSSSYSEINAITSQRHHDVVSDLGARVDASNITSNSPLARLNQKTKTFSIREGHLLRNSAVEFLNGVKEVDNGIFNLITNSEDWLFEELDELLTVNDTAAHAEITIPYMSALYSYLFSKYAPTSELKKFSIMNLVLLIGAVPTWELGKRGLAKNQNYLLSNYNGGPIDPKSIGQWISWKYNPETVTVRTSDAPALDNDSQTDRQITGVVLGGVFLGLIVINTILATMERQTEFTSKIAFASTKAFKVFRRVITTLLQVSQVPADAMHFRLNKDLKLAHDDAHQTSAKIEVVIWSFQWFPVVVDYISLTTGGPGSPQWNSPFYPGKQLDKGPAVCSFLTSIYGSLHALSFIGLLVSELIEVNDGSNHDKGEEVDMGIKFVGNFFSCIPEILAFPGYANNDIAIYDPDPETKAAALIMAKGLIANDAIMNVLWAAISSIRLGIAIGDGRIFENK